MNRVQRLEDGSNARGVLQVREADAGAEFQNGNHDIPEPRRTPPRPKWGLLYAVLPLTLLLFTLADVVPETSRWRTVTESIAVLLVFGALAAWVRFNRSALADLSQEKSGAPSDTTPRSR